MSAAELETRSHVAARRILPVNYWLAYLAAAALRPRLVGFRPRWLRLGMEPHSEARPREPVKK